MPKRLVIALIVIAVITAAVILYVALTPQRQGVSGEGESSSIPIPKEIAGVIKDSSYSVVFRVIGFKNGSRIPVNYTCMGRNVNPEIRILRIPPNTSTLVLIMYDPDAIGGVFYHWVIYDIPPNTTTIPPGLPRTPVTSIGYQGYNDFPTKNGKMIGYGGPCPPRGKPHRYVFIMIALNKELSLAPPVSVYDVLFAARGHVVGYGLYYGVYQR